MPSFILASASPARRKLLQMVGINPLVSPSDFDESQVKVNDCASLVTTLACAKAETVQEHFDDGLILGCDSVLSFGGKIYGKPASAEIAIARWQQMRGNTGLLYTGHVLLDLRQEIQVCRCGITKVYFNYISDRQIRDYVATGEPLKCAGGFALEGKGGLFIEKIDGCYSNVIGLSLPLLYQMLEELGYDVSDFW